MKTIWNCGIRGVLGGLAGAWIMQRFRIMWDRRQTATSETGIFGFDEEADINSVDQLCYLLSLPPLPAGEASQAALVLHFAYGAFAGGTYGLIARRFPGARTASGLLFGIALWLVGDEWAISASGISKPGSRPASSHLSALFAHLLYGCATDLALGH